MSKVEKWVDWEGAVTLECENW